MRGFQGVMVALLGTLALCLWTSAQTPTPTPVPTPNQSFSNCTVILTATQVTISCPITPPPPPLTITSPVTLPAARVNQLFQANLALLAAPKGGTPPYTYTPDTSTASTSWPGWLTLTSAGMLTGMPPTAGAVPISFIVTDSAKGGLSATFSSTVHTSGAGR